MKEQNMSPKQAWLRQERDRSLCPCSCSCPYNPCLCRPCLCRPCPCRQGLCPCCPCHHRTALQPSASILCHESSGGPCRSQSLTVHHSTKKLIKHGHKITIAASKVTLPFKASCMPGKLTQNKPTNVINTINGSSRWCRSLHGSRASRLKAQSSCDLEHVEGDYC